MDLWQKQIDTLGEGKGKSASDDAAVLLVGSKGSGKSSVINRYQNKEMETHHTLAINYQGVPYKKNGVEKVLNFWEVGSGIRFSNLSDFIISYNPNILIFICCNLIDLDSIAETLEWLDYFNNKGVTNAFVLGTHFDLFSSRDPQFQATIGTGLNSAAAHVKYGILFCSSSNGDGFDNLKSAIAKVAISKTKFKDRSVDPTGMMVVGHGNDRDADVDEATYAELLNYLRSEGAGERTDSPLGENRLASDPAFAEEEIDSMRVSRLAELQHNIPADS